MRHPELRRDGDAAVVAEVLEELGEGAVVERVRDAHRAVDVEQHRLQRWRPAQDRRLRRRRLPAAVSKIKSTHRETFGSEMRIRRDEEMQRLIVDNKNKIEMINLFV